MKKKKAPEAGRRREGRTRADQQDRTGTAGDEKDPEKDRGSTTQQDRKQAERKEPTGRHPQDQVTQGQMEGPTPEDNKGQKKPGQT